MHVMISKLLRCIYFIEIMFELNCIFDLLSFAWGLLRIFRLNWFFFYLFDLFVDLQNSSVEGVFPQQRSTHPFRIIENDTISIQSMTSLGRVGRILAGTVDVTNSIADKDTQSINASIMDSNATTSTSNVPSMMATATVISTGDSAAAAATATPPSAAVVINERRTKSVTSCSANDSSTSSNDNTSNSAMIFQGKITLYQIVLLLY